ncbi:hypothetical protein [Actinoplanes solisilvae]|uniref:hypothetical protein n=1 Tax=Actinoplanes solisilvae TaxID=2486853 RepID=UPI001F0C8CF9|nr:hypothetical protein [Actinoplanes solisilvae]
MSLVDLRHGFRDENQLRLTQAIVMDRLADDREQEECRVLMKFWWQLAMTYREVTEADLDLHVSPAKREAVQELIDAIRNSPEAIDAWLANTPRRFPTVQDRGYEAHRSRVSRTDDDVAADLARAGLEFIERMTTEVSYPLPASGQGPASCTSEHGRFDSEPHEIVHVDDPDMPAKVNAAWWRLALEFGLLDERQEFLLTVDYAGLDADESEGCWVRVRLADAWDLAGSGSASLRSHFAAVFTERFVPEFTMLSTDQKMVLNTTVWGDATVSTIVVRPDRITSAAG